MKFRFEPSLHAVEQWPLFINFTYAINYRNKIWIAEEQEQCGPIYRYRDAASIFFSSLKSVFFLWISSWVQIDRFSVKVIKNWKVNNICKLIHVAKKNGRY